MVCGLAHGTRNLVRIGALGACILASSYAYSQPALIFSKFKNDAKPILVEAQKMDNSAISLSDRLGISLAGNPLDAERGNLAINPSAAVPAYIGVPERQEAKKKQLPAPVSKQTFCEFSAVVPVVVFGSVYPKVTIIGGGAQKNDDRKTIVSQLGPFYYKYSDDWRDDEIELGLRGGSLHAGFSPPPDGDCNSCRTLQLRFDFNARDRSIAELRFDDEIRSGDWLARGRVKLARKQARHNGYFYEIDASFIAERGMPASCMIEAGGGIGRQHLLTARLENLFGSLNWELQYSYRVYFGEEKSRVPIFGSLFDFADERSGWPSD